MKKVRDQVYKQVEEQILRQAGEQLSQVYRLIVYQGVFRQVHNQVFYVQAYEQIQEELR